MAEGRDSAGRFTQKHTDAEVLAAVRAHEPAATSEVADELGIARQSADYRLRKLRDDGRVNAKKIGAALVWFPVDEADTRAETAPAAGTDRNPRRDDDGRDGRDASENGSPTDRSDRDRERDHDHDRERERERDRDREREHDREHDHDLDAALANVDVPGSGENAERRRAALREMYELLRANGAARKRDFSNVVDARSAGYGNFESFWSNFVKARSALAQLPGVKAPGEGEHTWRFVDTDTDTDTDTENGDGDTTASRRTRP